MSGLTQQRRSSVRYISRDFRPIAAGATIYPGALACINLSGGSAGYYTNGQAGTGVAAVGRFTEFASVSPSGTGNAIFFDNSTGSNGTISVQVEFFDPFWVFLLNNDTGTPIVASNRGGYAYVLDDQTVTGAASGNGYAGQVYDVFTSGPNQGVWVRVGVPALAIS